MKKINYNPNESIQNLLNLMTAYQHSRVLFTLMELKIPKLLNNHSLTSIEIAKRKKIEPIAMDRFLSAAVSLGLLKKTNDNFSNTEMTRQFLVKGNEFYLGGQIERQRKRSFSVWNQLTKHLKNWKNGEDKSLPQTNDQGAEAMAEQHKLSLLQGFALASAFDFSKYKRILDLGGGTGATSIALCKTYQHLQSIVYDLPDKAKTARKFIEAEKLTERIEVLSGDFKEDEIPETFDVVLLANFMSVADAADNQLLLQKLYQKLPQNGVCILSGWIIDNSRLSPQISVLFCLEDICWNAPDVERSEQVYTKWLTESGFKNINCKTYFEPTKMLYGFKV